MRVPEGDLVVWNPVFGQAALDYRFAPELCWPRAANQKGAVENLVGWVKGSFFKCRRFHERADLEAQLAQWLVAVNTQRPSRARATAAGPGIRALDRRGGRIQLHELADTYGPKRTRSDAHTRRASGRTGQLPAGQLIERFDEIHGYRTWDILEALQPDPTRPDAQVWITSYASIYHRPGVPLFDLCQQGRAGTDPRLYFSWYAADFTTDPDFVAVDPETRANPSRGTWADADYLAQQQRRLPAHKYRRLHLNLPGLPEGSAFTVEMVMEAVDRGVARRPPEPGLTYTGFVDMSGGSADDATLGIAHRGPRGGRILDVVMNQGPPPPFDPRLAVARFAEVLHTYQIVQVVGDAYGGQTFREDFRRYGVEYVVAERTTSQHYEALEPLLNAREVRLVDVPALEQQLLGLIWRGSKIDHPAGEHDDFSAAAAGALVSSEGRVEAPLW